MVHDFTELLAQYRVPIERYVKFRLPIAADADDVLQEIFLTAYRRFDQLQDKQAFLAWLMAIARTKCADYFRARARQMEIPLEIREEILPAMGLRGRTQRSAVRETLSSMARGDQQLLYLYYFEQLPQADIAQKLGLPIGTVKSRLHAAKQRFRTIYPYPPRTVKGEKNMHKLFEKLPEYKITPSALPPFEARWEEMMGWMIVPRLGEQLSWGLYEQPGGKRTEYCEMQVVGRAEVHGIEGVEITAVQYNAEDYYRTGSIDRSERRFIAQLTDTHCRVLAESHIEDGVRKNYTFLDGEAFLNNWGFGEDNCGNEVQVSRKGILRREGNAISSDGSTGMDVIGRYTVEINGKSYDTICVVDIDTFNDGVLSEDYIDKNGRTVLWRRFNKDDWALNHFGPQTWSERLPENEQITVNGETYVHWYDCVSDYISE